LSIEWQNSLIFLLKYWFANWLEQLNIPCLCPSHLFRDLRFLKNHVWSEKMFSIQFWMFLMLVDSDILHLLFNRDDIFRRIRLSANFNICFQWKSPVLCFRSFQLDFDFQWKWLELPKRNALSCFSKKVWNWFRMFEFLFSNRILKEWPTLTFIWMRERIMITRFGSSEHFPISMHSRMKNLLIKFSHMDMIEFPPHLHH
jgi:hypothetical protein